MGKVYCRKFVKFEKGHVKRDQFNATTLRERMDRAQRAKEEMDPRTAPSKVITFKEMSKEKQEEILRTYNHNS